MKVHEKEVYKCNEGRFEVWPSLELDFDNFGWHRVEVFIPNGVKEGRCDVVYMNDGGSAFQPGISGHSWNAHKTVSQLVERGSVVPLLIVAVHARKREYEYLLEKEFCWLGWDGGGLPDYARFLAGLKEFIDTTYPTNSESRRNSLVGSSHGGLASFYTGCVYSRDFGNLAAMSPSLWAGGVFDLRNTSLIHQVRESFNRNPDLRPRIWLDWGLNRGGGFHNLFIEAQATRWGRRLAGLLQKDFGYVAGGDLFLHEDPIGGHDEQAWAHRFGLMLECFHGRS